MAANQPELEPELEVQQYTIADFDLMWCERYLVAYIELMTPPASESEDVWWSMKSREFPDLELNFVDILGRSLVSLIVISYIRPWFKSRRSDGSAVRLPETTFRDFAKVFRRDDESQRLLPFHHDLHNRLLKERNQVVGHSDFTR